MGVGGLLYCDACDRVFFFTASLLNELGIGRCE